MQTRLKGCISESSPSTYHGECRTPVEKRFFCECFDPLNNASMPPQHLSSFPLFVKHLHTWKYQISLWYFFPKWRIPNKRHFERVCEKFSPIFNFLFFTVRVFSFLKIDLQTYNSVDTKVIVKTRYICYKMTRVQVFSSYFQELCQQSCFASEHYQFVPQTLVIVISPPVEVSHISMKKKTRFLCIIIEE